MQVKVITETDNPGSRHEIESLTKQMNTDLSTNTAGSNISVEILKNVESPKTRIAALSSAPQRLNTETITITRKVSNPQGLNLTRSAENFEVKKNYGSYRHDLNDNLNSAKSRKFCSTQGIINRRQSSDFTRCVENNEPIEVKTLTNKFPPLGSNEFTSPITSDKESSIDTSCPKREKFSSYSHEHKILMSDDSDSYFGKKQPYCMKVENLRKDLELILSKWIMTVKDQVSDPFYERVRQSFECFIEEVEDYNTTKSCIIKNSQRPVPPLLHHEAILPCHSSITSYQKSTKCATYQRTVPVFGTALKLTDRINERLSHLIELLTKYQMCQKNHNPKCVCNKESDEILEKARRCQKHKTTESEVERLINFMMKKLNKYKTKYGVERCRNLESSYDHKYQHKTGWAQKLIDSNGNDKYASKSRNDKGMKVSVWMRALPPNEPIINSSIQRKRCKYQESIEKLRNNGSKTV